MIMGYQYRLDGRNIPRLLPGGCIDVVVNVVGSGLMLVIERLTWRIVYIC